MGREREEEDRVKWIRQFVLDTFEDKAQITREDILDNLETYYEIKEKLPKARRKNELMYLAWSVGPAIDRMRASGELVELFDDPDLKFGTMRLHKK